jgi:nucleolar protein 56
MSVDYLLHESSVGYAVALPLPLLTYLYCHTNSIQVFKVNMQADTIGNRLKEVQTKAQDLATFGTTIFLELKSSLFLTMTRQDGHCCLLCALPRC